METNNNPLAILRGLPPLPPISGDSRLSTPKITPEGCPQPCLYIQPSQHQSPLTLPKAPPHPSTRGIISLPNLQLLRSTQETTSLLILHRCNTHTNLARARALLITPCCYMGAELLHRSFRRHRTSYHPDSQLAVAATRFPARIRAYLVRLQRMERGYMTDQGHGGPVFQCHDQAWAHSCQALLVQKLTLPVCRTIFFFLFIF
jgi:hypothetical protein